MKKIIALLLTLVMIATAISGCSLLPKMTAYGLYERSAEKIEKAGGAEVDCDVTIGMFGITLTINANIKRNGDNSCESMNFAGETVTNTIIGNDQYVDSDGLKYRYVMDERDPDDTPLSDSWIWDFTEADFEGVEIVENEDGTKTITLVEADGEMLAGFFGDSDLGLFDSEDEDEEVSIENISLVFTFNEDNDIDKVHLEADLVVTAYGAMSLTCTLAADYTFINLGTAPEITAPEDADDYLLIDKDQLDEYENL